MTFDKDPGYLQAAQLLKSWDDILVICHANPDGDALGSMAGLVWGLRALGKRAAWYCGDPVPPRFSYLFEGMEKQEFSPAHIVTVDVADPTLLGDAWDKFGHGIELAIDHHGTHKSFSPTRWVCPNFAATAEMVWLLLQELQAVPSKELANSIYTGIATDTGCFRHRNTSPHALRTAAEMLELGAEAGDINQKIFGTKSRAQIQAEGLVAESMEFACQGKVALVQIPLSIYKATGATEDELGSLADMPRQVEGVLVGVTLKEKPEGKIKVGVRVNPPANAAEICGKFGGGGHVGAAGCTLAGMDMEEARQTILAACQAYLANLG